MKFLSVSLKLSAGVLLLSGVCLVGCQKASEPGDYQEYSGLSQVEKTGASPTETKNDSPSAPDQTAEQSPARAEKLDQPAVAQASYERAANTETQSVSTPARPGDPFAKVDNKKEKEEPREIKLLIPDKTFDKASADGTLRVSYDDLDLLKILNMQPVPTDAADYFPEWLEQLDGKRVRIRGFMYPAFQSTGLRGFVMARDNQICCFGRDPKVYDLIVVKMKEGTTTDYIPPTRSFDVEGTFHIRPEVEDDLWLGLYEIHDAKVLSGRSR